jgi:hypothetical protein
MHSDMVRAVAGGTPDGREPLRMSRREPRRFAPRLATQGAALAELPLTGVRVRGYLRRPLNSPHNERDYAAPLHAKEGTHA